MRFYCSIVWRPSLIRCAALNLISAKGGGLIYTASERFLFVTLVGAAMELRRNKACSTHPVTLKLASAVRSVAPTQTKRRSMEWDADRHTNIFNELHFIGSRCDRKSRSHTRTSHSHQHRYTLTHFERNDSASNRLSLAVVIRSAIPMFIFHIVNVQSRKRMNGKNAK